MPHIHTQPGQHDMTVSGYIIRRSDDGEWLCLVHMHRKIDMLMQIGGHIELTQTPWQAIVAELHEETGYEPAELKLVQWAEIPQLDRTITHPLPLLMNTHMAGEGHYHSDTCYGFIARGLPKHATAEGESNDLRWLSLAELHAAALRGDALRDVAEMYEYLIASEPTMQKISATDFSLEKPQGIGITYKR
jgi:8-oxo-dGTP pyrophosphatase MutT (NUDIX family)